MTFRAPVSAVLLALVAACSGNGVLSLGNYDTSCQKDADCTAVYVGPPECCECPDGAINVSDQAKYAADAAAIQHGVCDVACFKCTSVTAVCVEGTCSTTSDVADAGPGG